MRTVMRAKIGCQLISRFGEYVDEGKRQSHAIWTRQTRFKKCWAFRGCRESISPGGASNILLFDCIMRETWGVISRDITTVFRISQSNSSIFEAPPGEIDSRHPLIGRSYREQRGCAGHTVAEWLAWPAGTDWSLGWCVVFGDGVTFWNVILYMSYGCVYIIYIYIYIYIIVCVCVFMWVRMFWFPVVNS